MPTPQTEGRALSGDRIPLNHAPSLYKEPRNGNCRQANSGKPRKTLYRRCPHKYHSKQTFCYSWRNRGGPFPGTGDDNFRKIHDTFFRSFEAAGTLSEYCQLLGNLLEFILRHTPLRSFILSGEIFRELYGGLEKLKNTLFGTSFLHNNDGENRRIICDFIREHLKSIRIPFETKPVEDLEIIGVLESRNIAFDTVIMLDVNEGIIPQAKKINPLIPLGIYDILGIPSTEFNEEIFRYYFYRLIRSARHVHLIYTDSEEMPRSRYIEQLIWNKKALRGH
jgi:hypothetical protein